MSRLPYIETTDSAATTMRAVAAALRGAWMDPQTWPAWMVRLAGPANHLPPRVREQLVAYAVRNIGVNPSLAAEVTTAGLAGWAVDLYEQDAPPDEQYDSILIGAPSGGIAHLAALLHAPFLSQHFVTRYRYRGHPDDIAAYHAFGTPLAEGILDRNPDLAVINHYDPIHDRFLIPYANYIRMKLLDLPAPYAAFIERRLRPGGVLLFVDCQYTWGQYRIGRRHYFQVGGLGGIADEVWVKGSDEVTRFLTEHGRPGQHNWSLPYPWLRTAESEWGSLAPFQTAVETFAAQHGYRFRSLRATHPEDYSRLAFYAGYQAALNAGREPAGVLVDCFTQTSPTAAVQGNLLPLWLPFNCTDSLAFLQQMSGSFPHGKPVLLAPAPGFSPAWDTCRASDWPAACSPAEAVWMGVDPAALPVDLAGLFRFVPALQAWCRAAGADLRPAAFNVDDLEALIASMAAQASAEAQAERNVTENNSLKP